jgi:hypothetical protein
MGAFDKTLGERDNLSGLGIYECMIRETHAIINRIGALLIGIFCMLFLYSLSQI